jgi:hypothetical protein
MGIPLTGWQNRMFGRVSCDTAACWYSTVPYLTFPCGSDPEGARVVAAYCSSARLLHAQIRELAKVQNSLNG